MVAEPVEGRPINRTVITVFIMMSAIIQVLDTTIANVALPHMQGSLSASLEQIEWVLTSYIVAAAIMTPTTGWIASRFGAKRFILVCVAGFTAASVLCGTATSLTQMVLDRILQGIFGAALVPMSQAVMLDIYPKEKHGAAMAIWSLGTVIGPILGPTLGGWITENYTWRWVFYINLPLGIAAFIGIRTFLPAAAPNRQSRLDWFGFALLGLAIGAFQLMLDRGEQLDWFDSTEIVAEAAVAGAAFYLFLVHSLTAETPFIKPGLFKDFNFLIGSVFMFINTVVFFSSLALSTPFLQNLIGYSVLDAGILQAPRSLSTAVTLVVVGRLVSRVDLRLLISLGLLLTTYAFWQMTGFTADTSKSAFIIASIFQGTGLGFIFVPLTTLTFATLAPQNRADGTGLFSLMRNLGASAGISALTALLTANIQINHADIVENIRPTNPLLRMPAIVRFWNPLTPHGVANLEQEITRQATTIAFVDDFRLLMGLCLVLIPLLLLVRKPEVAGQGSVAIAD